MSGLENYNGIGPIWSYIAHKNLLTLGTRYAGMATKHRWYNYIMKMNQAIMIVNKTAISKKLRYRKGALVV